MSKLPQTLQRGCKDLLSFMVGMLTIILGFTIFAHYTFGQNVTGYVDVEERERARARAAHRVCYEYRCVLFVTLLKVAATHHILHLTLSHTHAHTHAHTYTHQIPLPHLLVRASH